MKLKHFHDVNYVEGLEVITDTLNYAGFVLED